MPPKDFELINELNKIAGCKINIQKSVRFCLLIVNYLKEKVKKIPFTAASKIIEYLGINLIKKVTDLYSENYKTLMKKLKLTEINGKTYHAHILEELILLKCLYSLKQYADSM